ncbi:MAG: hypothetical protein VXW04_01410, partial [Bacteroidota bacterium]|nr:hypothetical protein [Bacteroidota bacterium]
TELLIQKVKNGQSIVKSKGRPIFFDEAVNELKNYFNTSVAIKVNEKGKGTIQIPFNSQKDLDDIIKKIKRED